MRFDRFLTLNVVHPIRWVTGANGKGSVPILMYHGISNHAEPGAPSLAYYKTNTSPEIFRRHIDYLAENGFRTLALADLIEQLRRNAPLPAKSVVITFDDGLRNFQTEAFPILRKHGFTATMFVPTGFIRTPRKSFKNQECLTWEEVRELRKAGMEFGSHTVTHPRLVELAWKDIRHELRASREDLEQRLGEPVTIFSHPFAFPEADSGYVSGFREALVETGYACCVTTRLGRVKIGDDLFSLKRLPANTMDDPSFFGAKLNGDYDWLAVPQRSLKKIKNPGFAKRPASRE